MIIKVINPQPKKIQDQKKISNIKKNIKSNPKGNNIMTKEKQQQGEKEILQFRFLLTDQKDIL